MRFQRWTLSWHPGPCPSSMLSTPSPPKRWIHSFRAVPNHSNPHFFITGANPAGSAQQQACKASPSDPDPHSLCVLQLPGAPEGPHHLIQEPQLLVTHSQCQAEQPAEPAVQREQGGHLLQAGLRDWGQHRVWLVWWCLQGPLQGRWEDVRSQEVQGPIQGHDRQEGEAGGGEEDGIAATPPELCEVLQGLGGEPVSLHSIGVVQDESSPDCRVGARDAWTTHLGLYDWLIIGNLFLFEIFKNYLFFFDIFIDFILDFNWIFENLFIIFFTFFPDLKNIFRI